MTVKPGDRGYGTMHRILPKRGNKPCPHGEEADCGCPWRVQFQDPQTGRQRERRFYDKKEAKKFLLKVNHEKARLGKIPGFLLADSPRFEEYAWEWLEAREDLAKGTKTSYASKLRSQLIPEFGNKKVGKITRKDVERFRDRLYTQGVNVGNANLMISGILGGILEAAREGDYRADNPAREISLREVPESEPYLPETEEIWDLVEAIEDRFELTILLQALLGLRAGEALAGGTECVRGTVYRVYRQWMTSGEYAPLKHKKPGEYREIPISPRLAQAIEAHCEQFGIRSGPFFPSPRDPEIPISRSTYQRAFTIARIKIGNEALVPHSLRHWFGTHMSRRTHAAAVKEWMGHERIQTTIERYYHMIDETMREGAAAIDAAFLERKALTQ